MTHIITKRKRNTEGYFHYFLEIVSNNSTATFSMCFEYLYYINQIAQQNVSYTGK